VEPWPNLALVIACGVLAAAAGLFVVLWLFARRSRNRLSDELRTAEAELRDRERTGAEHAERTRAARDTLAVASRGLSAIVTQAEGAMFAGGAEPQAAVRAAASIADAARRTLVDLRRASDVIAGDLDDEHADQVLVTREQLVEVMRAAGLHVNVVETGEPFELSSIAEFAVLRILHEALSNALEFGGEGTEATVSLSWTGDSLQLRVDDDGVRAAARRAGLDPDEVTAAHRTDEREHLETLVGASGDGITRMRARADLLGGVFKAAPVPGVGFSVAVVFPSLRHDNGVHPVKPSVTRAPAV
jgi:signal transduction histidine kinase